MDHLICYLAMSLLSVFGWFISFYFYQVHMQRMREEVWWMPKILRMTDCRCDEIVDSEFGQTFGRSNAFWGLWYYSILLIILTGNWFLNLPSTGILFIIVLLAFAHSIYLAWGLYLLRVVCRPCLGAHVLNLLIFIIQLYHAFPLLIAKY